MLSLLLDLYFLLFYQRFIANMIGAACNSRIPQANAEVKSFSVCFFYIHMSNVSLKYLLVLLQMVIDHPFDRLACGICELQAKPIMSTIYHWENLCAGTWRS